MKSTLPTAPQSTCPPLSEWVVPFVVLLIFTGAALTRLIRDYAREAGVRQLEQLIAKVCRKVATAKARSTDRASVGARRRILQFESFNRDPEEIVVKRELPR